MRQNAIAGEAVGVQKESVTTLILRSPLNALNVQIIIFCTVVFVMINDFFITRAITIDLEI